MHVLGISAGTLNGNSEVLLKAALQAAEQAHPGLTTSMARIRYMRAPRNGAPLAQSIVPHITTYRPGAPGSDDVDDRPALYEAIMRADAIIVSTPVYSHLPPGHIKCFIDDTLGPGADIALALATDEEGNGLGRKPRSAIDPRLYKARVSAFMVVAGSPGDMPEQWTLGLVGLHQSMYSIQATTVDQACFAGYGPPGSVCSDESNTVARAQLLGKRVVSQLGLPVGAAEFLGESQEGSCPYCHGVARRLVQARVGAGLGGEPPYDEGKAETRRRLDRQLSEGHAGSRGPEAIHILERLGGCACWKYNDSKVGAVGHGHLTEYLMRGWT